MNNSRGRSVRFAEHLANVPPEISRLPDDEEELGKVNESDTSSALVAVACRIKRPTCDLGYSSTRICQVTYRLIRREPIAEVLLATLFRQK